MMSWSRELACDVQALFSDFYKGGESFLERIGENVTWIGQNKSEIYQGACAVQEYIRNQRKLLPVQMVESSFQVVWEQENAALVEGTFVVEPLEEEEFLWKNYQRCSVLLEKMGELYKIVHLHVSDCHDDIVWRRDLISQVQRDPLTQIYNVRTVREKVEQWLEAEKGHEGCAMCMIDVDNFKDINDTFGHMIGNDILVQVASILCQAAGNAGITGRAGGDEFLVFLKSGEEEQVQKFVDSLEDRIREETIYEQMQITVSIGVAVANKQDASYKSLFQMSDRALYEAKKKGKDTSHLTVLTAPETIIS